MTALVIREVSLSLGARQLFAPLSLRIEPGVITSVTGPSGAGKSSLLGYACGVLADAFTGRGDVLLGDERLNDLPPESRRLGLLFQDDLLFPHLSVAGNLAFGMRRGSLTRVGRRRRIAESLVALGLSGFEHRDPATLSGGERSRVALLRVLLSEPRGLLLDEPFGRLDAATRVQTRALVFAEIQRRSLPALLVTHDADDVAAAAGPIAELRSLLES